MTYLHSLQANDININWSVKMVQFKWLFVQKTKQNKTKRTCDAYKYQQTNKQTKTSNKQNKTKQKTYIRTTNATNIGWNVKNYTVQNHLLNLN